MVLYILILPSNLFAVPTLSLASDFSVSMSLKPGQTTIELTARIRAGPEASQAFPPVPCMPNPKTVWPCL
ncbi:uncharacterized protein BDZ83DRAFT_636158 [Colletotrichum acutatum]|uniref:Secreted protein n=1 Tax=Glomerella acutata TaxID=27357 RepID=A0AAD8UEA0_GLOAC|nr:uncharacterized protein BDZ83DRAFT_636158 [Colletotrichum acutatum]KAK1715006.1 hypothetical protein BDZ83DRAFT_636158 [Colletotrichum acutatum]